MSSTPRHEPNPSFAMAAPAPAVSRADKFFRPPIFKLAAGGENVAGPRGRCATGEE